MAQETTNRERSHADKDVDGSGSDSYHCTGGDLQDSNGAANRSSRRNGGVSTSRAVSAGEEALVAQVRSRTRMEGPMSRNGQTPGGNKGRGKKSRGGRSRGAALAHANNGMEHPADVGE